ncbi:SigE family RNA polymerase sigma factor [Nocardioides sp.]|uniref:SigE family RNA polymerase sigma factor n=1 Tax=Nocardioides sp. TaxID=35761 RepID=UPI00286BD3CE|nr:SigE family RNA polymerase sigma factor [Nocardioides sp.]
MPAGQDLGFDALVRITAPALHRTALLLTGGDHHLAEDLMQGTYVKVWVAWKQVSRADDPVAYTRTVLTRTFLSHRRLRRSSERPTDELGLSESSASGDQDPVLRLDMLDALRRLTPKDRAVVVHRYWLDRSVTETATDLALSEAVVRTRSKRALARLRAQFTDLDLDPREDS